MPRSRPSKKVKTKHHNPKANGGGDLSQAEIWDDSALIRSWNDAVAEYEYYHSIHATGEDVEEILRRAENGELDDDDAGADAGTAAGKGVSGEWHDVDQKVVTAQAVDDDEVEDGEVDDDSELSAAKAALTQKVTAETVQTEDVERLESTQQQPTVTTTTNVVDSNTTPSIPLGAQQTPSQSSMPTVGPNLPTASEQDQTLENIKMAYYWAGYYSGLYDGQRQASHGGGA